MYFLFTAIPFIGHLNPLLRQAAELQRRGHRVAFAGAAEVAGHVSRESPHVPFVEIGPLGPVAEALRRNNESASLDPNFVRGSFRVVRGLNAVWLLMFDCGNSDAHRSTRHGRASCRCRNGSLAGQNTLQRQESSRRH